MPLSEAHREHHTSLAFNAVAGHVDRIFYGSATEEGESTLRKKTTAWEVLHYLAMYFHDAILNFLLADPSSVALGFSMEGDRERAVDELSSYVKAIQGLRRFTPQLFSLCLPFDWAPSSPVLVNVAEGLGGVEFLRQPGQWLGVREPAYESLWVPLFLELYQAMDAADGYGVHDEQRWGIGLVDLTSGYDEPAAMDVKTGFLRYGRCTPAAKVAKINRKDEGSILRKVALRVCGLRRYIHSPQRNGEGTDGDKGATEVEHQGKPLGFAITDAATMRCYVRGFYSTQQRLATTSLRAHGETEQVSGSPTERETVTLIDRTNIVETAAEMRRCRLAHDTLERMLHYFRETEGGRYLLDRFAFVATSALCTYDASDSSGERCSLSVIDLAMSSTRRLNYAEAEVGFLTGLANLREYLS